MGAGRRLSELANEGSNGSRSEGSEACKKPAQQCTPSLNSQLSSFLATVI